MEAAASAPLLLVGRTGQVASALQRLAPELLPGRPLLALGRPDLDLADAAFCQNFQAALDQHRPALVINSAAYTAVDRAESEPGLAHQVNGDAVGAMARACGSQGVPLMHLSTDYVFDGGGKRSWQPTDPPAPLGVYGASKLNGERQISAAVEAQGTRALVLRVSWVFGQQGTNFVHTMLRLAAERDELKVVADQLGGPTSAESIARALIVLVAPAIENAHPVRGKPEPFPWGTYHFQGQPLVSWHGFAREIMRQAVALHLLEKLPVVTAIGTAEFPTPARRPANSRLDCRSAEAELGLELPAWREDLLALLLAAARSPVQP